MASGTKKKYFQFPAYTIRFPINSKICWLLFNSDSNRLSHVRFFCRRFKAFEVNGFVEDEPGWHRGGH